MLLGDLLYHGPRNDLPDRYDPKAVTKMLNENKNELLCVRGNCDAEVDQMVLEFPILADYAIIPLKDRLIYASHGHHYNPQTPPPLCDGDILLNGHTHVTAWQESYWNPGSVSIPKEGTAHGYMLLTDSACEWRTLEDDELLHRTEW